MEIFTSILALLAGVGVFITGMNLMSQYLQKVAGPGMKKLISTITNNRFAGVGIGTAVTGLIQSSAATTVMAIGFVNAGAMTLLQAAPIIMGANIGTTVTGLLVALSSFEISVYFSALAFIGVMMMFIKKPRYHNTGRIICGLGLLFIGLDLMSHSTSNDAMKAMFTSMFAYVDFPLLLFLIGIVITSIMQSSSAMIGLVVVMATRGAITVGDSLFLIVGANVGTCVTSLIATIGTSTNAKRTGILHLTIKLIGAIVFIPFMWIFKDGCVYLLSFIPEISFQIAICHVVFNVLLTAMLLPFTKYLVKLVELMIPEKEKEFSHALKFIDDLELRTPAIAVMQVKKEIENMAFLAKENLAKSFYSICHQDEKYADEINKRENQIDYLNAEITSFLIKLSPLVDGNSVSQVGSYYHVINDIERIGDHAENFLQATINMKEQGIKFSGVAIKELENMFNTVNQMFDLAIKTFDNTNDVDLLELSNLEKATDDMKKKYSISHFERLAEENCTMELGAHFTSIISGLERVGDHLVNIGYSVQNPTGNQLPRYAE